MRKTILFGAALAAVMLAPSAAQAVPIVIGGTGALGSFTGTFDYDETLGVVDVSLTNTSPVANGGFITGFVFNLPSTADVSASVLTASNANFVQLGASGGFDNGVNGQPGGLFDIGAALGGSYEGGGDPHDGIGVGGSATFSFKLTGTGLGGLTAADFLSTLSAAHNDDHQEDFVVRFRGFANGGSDKVPDGGGPTPVPEPGTAMLLGLGLASLAARRRARSR